jgi:TPP-dependent pyruvate/acetoin dehydrogenase alpha subunit
MAAAAPTDYVVSTHRGHGHLIAKGADPAGLLAEICGRATGFCRGKGGSQHIAVKAIGFLGTNGITGGGLPVAAGAALSIKLRRTGQVVLCFFGDGAANQGTFHEALNMAAIWRLPIVFICENNRYAMYTPVDRVTSVASIQDRAASYGMTGRLVDGMDLLAVRDAAHVAIGYARAGQGPTLLEAETYRYCGHSKSDTGAYRPSAELAAWQARDPLRAWREHLLARGIDETELTAVEAAVDCEIGRATRLALDSPYAEDEALTGAYAERGTMADTPIRAEVRA